MRFASVFLVVCGLAGGGCAESSLETHIRSAYDFRAVNAAALTQIRERCPDIETSDGCLYVRTAQHAFVDAHTVWVQALETDRRAGRWDNPTDADEAALVDTVYSTLVTKAWDWLELVLPRAPESFRRIYGAE